MSKIIPSALSLCESQPTAVRPSCRCVMTPEQSRMAKTLIKNLCCNYIDGNCILLDDGEPCVCPQTITSSLLCKWFRTAVLPNDKELYIKLMKPENSKTCPLCGKVFLYRSQNKKYCDSCKKAVLRRQKANYQYKRRHRTD